MSSNRNHLFVFAFLATVGCAGTLEAQACFGLPTAGAVAYQNARYSIPKGHGAVASYGGGRFTAAGHYNTRTFVNDAVSGMDAGGRLALVLPLGRARICPGLGASVVRDKWEAPDNVTLTSNAVALRGGVAIGIEQHVYKGITFIPALGVHYEFSPTVYSVSATGGENETTADTLSHVAIDYSVALRYKFAFIAALARRYSDTGSPRAVETRFLLGFAFGRAYPGSETSR